MNSEESFNLIKFYQQPNPLISHISILCIRLPTTLDREFSTLDHLLHIIHLGNFQESSGYSILLLLPFVLLLLLLLLVLFTTVSAATH